MKQYQELVGNVMANGNYKPNRTGVDTISSFSQSYKIDLKEGFPLLTTKDLSGFRWNSLIHELLWYFSGEEHVRNLREKTGIWDAWADDEGRLDTAYGRFWRRYPIPKDRDRLPGEAWPDRDNEWVNEEGGRLTFDQIRYAIDTLNGENPDRSPNSRRLVITAWHPSNAAVSTLPPCHFTYVLNVQDGRLNTHLTQRSGDIALGIPFNIAAYSIITKIIAGQTDFEPGVFSHTIVDAHIYCGRNERGKWYDSNLSELNERVRSADSRKDYQEIRKWVLEEAPEEDEEGYDHVPGLLKQLSREPRQRPRLEISDKPIDSLEFEDFQLQDYNPHPGINFEVAE
ncbi:MAG: thymidylate synthase [Candidatus Nanohaloarchaea archaeon]|nr:thymidylate synthase [Candidatus Nanohaloarchaea archaeon]